MYLPRYYVTYPSIVKMNGLLSFCNVKVYKRLSLFIKKNCWYVLMFLIIYDHFAM